jgi:hypothetical protein
MGSKNDVQGCNDREDVIPTEMGLASKVTTYRSVRYLHGHELADLIRLCVSNS